MGTVAKRFEWTEQGQVTRSRKIREESVGSRTEKKPKKGRAKH